MIAKQAVKLNKKIKLEKAYYVVINQKIWNYTNKILNIFLLTRKMNF